MSDYKVFQMSEYEWVVAKSKEEAIAWYERETGESVDMDEFRECNIEKEGQYVEFTDAARIEELNAAGTDEVIVPKAGDQSHRGLGSLLKREGDWYIMVQFKDVLPAEEIPEPYITATTEW